MRFNKALELEKIRSIQEQEQDMLNPVRNKVTRLYNLAKVWHDLTPVRKARPRVASFTLNESQ
jgi:hypothetical protein